MDEAQEMLVFGKRSLSLEDAEICGSMSKMGLAGDGASLRIVARDSCTKYDDEKGFC